MPGDVADGDGGAGVIGVPSFSVTAVGTEGVSPLERGAYHSVGSYAQ